MTTRAEYAEYLQSDHWRALKRAKRESGDPVVCAVCGSIDGLDLHHLIYRNLIDVTCADLRWVCRACHDRIHALIDCRRLVYRSQNPGERWKATLAALGGLPDPFVRKRHKKPRRRKRWRSRAHDAWAGLPVAVQPRRQHNPFYNPPSSVFSGKAEKYREMELLGPVEVNSALRAARKRTRRWYKKKAASSQETARGS